jgi:N-acetylglucosaminyldiphosphoundecaprenol N-acetyl-beta-D-mannosaminyltransferase
VSSTPRVELLGLPFDGLTRQAALDRCLSWCEGPRAAHTVITANAAILCMMRRDPELRQSCRAGDLVLADGMSVVWLARLAGIPLPERVTGVDLMVFLLREGAKRKLRVYFLGAKPEVVSKLVALCAEQHPGLVVAGARDGYFKPGEEAAIADDIRQHTPDMLFVGMPSPFKENFCERFRSSLEVPVIIGVGGAFDVLAGHVRRAPRFMQAMGMEWFWRLLMEPRKMWKRYLTTNSEFAWLALREIVARRFGNATGSAQ